MNANSARRRPSSTKRALASLAVHPWRVAIRLRRSPLSTGRRMLITTERVAPIKKSPFVTLVTYETIVTDLFLGRLSAVHSHVEQAQPGHTILLQQLLVDKLFAQLVNLSGWHLASIWD